MKGSKEKESNLVTLMMLCVVFGLFTFAYKVGASQGREGHQHFLKASAKRDDILRRELDNCIEEMKRHRDVLKTSSTDDAASETENKLVETQTMNQKLRTALHDLVKMQEECVDQADTERALRETQDNLDIAEIARLEMRHETLRAQVQRMNSTMSLEGKILTATIGKLANEHNRLLQQLGKPQVKVTPEYLVELMMHWSSKNTARFHERLGDILPPNKTEIATNYKQPLKVNESIADEVEYFIAHHDDAPKIKNRQWTKPEWKGFVGNRPQSFGVQTDSIIQKSTAPRLMRMLYEYILCASGVNTPDLAFPAHFQNPEGEVENLGDLIITPHISFCKDCGTQHQTGAFRLLCLGYTSKEHYGSKLFWKVRSKLVPADHIRNEASMFLAEHNPEKMIGVRLPKSKGWIEKCAQISSKEEEPLMFLHALLDNAHQVSNDITEQCNPPVTLVAESINSWAKQVEAEAVFISTDMDAFQLEKLEKKLKVPVVRVEPGTYSSSSTAALVDITIQSQLGHVLVNRFDVQSAHITEYHMLNNKFSTQNIRVW